VPQKVLQVTSAQVSKHNLPIVIYHQPYIVKGGSTQFLIPVFHSPFSLKALITRLPKMAANKLTTQTLIFSQAAQTLNTINT